jgi:hypothetical protein
MWSLVVVVNGYFHIATNPIGQPFRFNHYEDAYKWIESSEWPHEDMIDMAWILNKDTGEIRTWNTSIDNY